MRFDAVLFDLDNTLLLYECERKFFSEYLDLCAEAFCDLCPPQSFKQQLMIATEHMVKDRDRSRPNARAFMESFCPLLGIDPAEASDRFDRFYQFDFPRLRPHCRPLAAAPQAVASARKAGMVVVCATNPVFPRHAVYQRLEWAGLNPTMFDLVTVFEDMHACKPHPEYYLEIVDKLQLEPRNCLMIGNDPVEDTAAAAVGMTVYLVDHGSWRGDVGCAPDYRGSLAQAPRLWEVPTVTA